MPTTPIITDQAGSPGGNPGGGRTGAATDPALPLPEDTSAAPQLTRREAQVLTMVRQGLTTKQIARSLGISPKTVEFHRGHLIRKFDVRNSVELAAKAADA